MRVCSPRYTYTDVYIYIYISSWCHVFAQAAIHARCAIAIWKHFRPHRCSGRRSVGLNHHLARDYRGHMPLEITYRQYIKKCIKMVSGLPK